MLPRKLTVHLVFAVTFSVACPVRAASLTENFTTTTFEDSLYTTADWDTVATALRLPPFVPHLVGTHDTPGMARDVAVDGNTAFVADQANGLQILDITDPSAATLLGAFDTSGSSLGIALSGNLVYVADSNAGLLIFDVSTATAPTLLGSFDTSGFAADVVVAGDHAYVADVNGGLKVIDVSNPAIPTLAASYATLGLAQGVAVDGNFVFIADDSFGLHVVDVSDPTTPLFAGFLDTAGSAFRVVVDGNHAYLADASGGLRIIDVTDPAAPLLVGTYNTTGTAYDVAVAGSRAYVADGSGGLVALDIADPTLPILLGSYDTTGSSRGIVIDGMHAFVADDASGLHGIEVAITTGPLLAGTVALTGVGTGDLRAWDVAVDGHFAFVAGDGGGGLQVLDISDPTEPFVVGSYDSPGLARGIAVSGDLAFLADASALLILDVSDPTAPAPLGSIATAGFARRVAISGDYAYLAAESAGLRAFDVSDPTAPTEVGTLDTIDARDIVVAGEIAYLSDVVAGLHVVSIADPAVPSLLATVNVGGSQGLDVAGDHAFVATTLGVNVVDISDPSTPISIASIVPFAFDVAVVEDLLLVSTSGPSLAMVDVSDPANPTALSSITLAGSAWSVAAAGRFVFSATDAAGLTVSQIAQDEVLLTSGLGQSLELDGTSVDSIVRARVSSTRTAGVELELSANGGTAFEAIAEGEWLAFGLPGGDLRWRSTHTWQPGINPTLSSLTVDWLNEHGPIASISDVPDDQGGRVYLQFARSGYDFADETARPIVQYGIYRRVDTPLAGTAMRIDANAEGLHGERTWKVDDQVYVDGAATAWSQFPEGSWALLTSVPATQTQLNTVEVTTTADSSTAGPNENVFLVTAHTVTPSVWFASEPDSGYSVDNIAPAAPQNVVAAYGASQIDLSWDAAPEPDFQYYNVYRSSDPNFVPSPDDLVLQTTDVRAQDAPSNPFQSYYRITVVDHAGNESEPGAPDTVTGTEDLLVARYALHAVLPNPFNPSTKIRFDLPQTGMVELTVYDVAGRRVRTLVQEVRNAGEHQVIWRGLDESRRQVASGVYLCRLRAGSYEETRRMTLLK